jgi:GNAT superfamily N-acetyltransferase
MPWLDEQAGAWKQARTDVCLNAERPGRVGREDLLDRAMWCLEDRHMELANRWWPSSAAATPRPCRRRCWSWRGCGRSTTCLDEALLLRQPAPPTRGREAIRDVRARALAGPLARARGRFQGGADGRHAGARAGGGGARLAASPGRRAHPGGRLLLERMGAYAHSETASREAYFTAASAGAWEVAAEAAIEQTWCSSGSHARAHRRRTRCGREHAAMALVHAGDRADLSEAERLNNLAVVHSATGAYAEAQALHERIVDLRAGLGPDHPTSSASASTTSPSSHEVTRHLRGGAWR